MTTIHNLNDCVVSNRKGPKQDNPGTDHDVRKPRTIPLMIDDYNKHRGGVGIANQLRSNLSTQLPRDPEWDFKQLPSPPEWLPLFYYLLDTTIVNSYLIYRMYNPSISHQDFRLQLSRALLSSGRVHYKHIVKDRIQRPCKAMVRI